MNKNISLSEYDYVFVGEDDFGHNKAVDAKTFQELESFVLQNKESVEYLKLGQNKYHKFLQAQNYVGVIQTRSGVTIEILPKISKKHEDIETSKTMLIKMLKTLRKSPFRHFNMAHLKSANMPLLEIFISMFLDELDRLVKQGIRSDYIDKEDNLKYLKGKLKFQDHIKHNYVHKEKFYVEYQEFSRDRIENRLIKTTLEYLYRRSKVNNNIKRIREFIFIFDDVGVTHKAETDFKNLHLNRQMKEYELILQWAKVFLLSHSFSPYKGKEVAFALLFDMNELFESYVGHMLKKRNFNVSLQDREHYLAYLATGEGKFQLKPDFLIRYDDEVIVADTKWKLLSEDKSHQGVSQADMYQLFAYGNKYNSPQCKNMYLIYPKGEDDLEESQYHYEKELDGLQLKILFFDLLDVDNNSFYDHFKHDTTVMVESV